MRMHLRMASIPPVADLCRLLSAVSVTTAESLWSRQPAVTRFSEPARVGPVGWRRNARIAFSPDTVRESQTQGIERGRAPSENGPHGTNCPTAYREAA